MPTDARGELSQVVVDAADPKGLARWWARALGWRVVLAADDEVEIAPPEGLPGLPLVFVPVPDAKRGPNRVHLDLDTDSVATQRVTVAALLDAGARRADVGQGQVPWEVLADPEGNEFCVLDPRPQYEGTGAVASVVVQALDPPRLGRFWALASGWDVVRQGADVVALRPPTGGPYLELVRTRSPHAVKNRWHLDLRPRALTPGRRGTAQHAVVAALLDAGARRADVGQGRRPWVVLADPEGNEFCVLTEPRG
ncbi:VOC family protein [Kineococcus glutinatus]|uniref:VOC family protein n=1 Tax=Kineococcus glutinatus TaxID=1070872 RepID=A0ABP9I0F4_9ACTN